MFKKIKKHSYLTKQYNDKVKNNGFTLTKIYLNMRLSSWL